MIVPKNMPTQPNPRMSGATKIALKPSSKELEAKSGLLITSLPEISSSNPNKIKYKPTTRTTQPTVKVTMGDSFLPLSGKKL
jgi:hypothetical protein